MTKIKALAILTAILTLSSCTKERTCSCKNPDGSAGSTYLITDTRSKAKKTCEGLSNSYQTCTLN